MNTGGVLVLSVTATTMAAPEIPDIARSAEAEAKATKLTSAALNHLENARDIDGVQLIRQHQNLISTSHQGALVSEALLTPVSSDTDIPPKLDFSKASSGRPPPIVQLDPDRYRKLAKGLVQLKSNIAHSSSSVPSPASAVGEKKKVRFSDQSGYDLYTLRSYTDQDVAPIVPIYATAYLKLDEDIEDVAKEDAALTSNRPCKILRTQFTQPGAMPDFITRIRQNKVALEFCLADEKNFTLRGSVRVLNVHFQKKVTVIFTNDHWKNKGEVDTHYVHYSHNDETDLFTFEIALPSTMEKGEPFEFVAKYEVNGAEHWDNNFGKNYIVTCAPLYPSS